MRNLCLAFLFSAPFFVFALETFSQPLILKAARVFDGHILHTGVSVLVEGGKVSKIGPHHLFAAHNAKVMDLGDATLLPGLIELHAHLSYRHVPEGTVLRHGITTLRDVGEPLHAPRGGNGTLRVLTSGPILTAPHGYPIPAMGTKNIAQPIANEEEGRKAVRDLIDAGAVVIKIALEPGGEKGGGSARNHRYDV